MKLFLLPRTVGSYKGIDIIATKGRFGPYLKYGDKNISLPRGVDPLHIGLEQSTKIVQEALSGASASPVIREFSEAGISVLNGRYGPYIKYGERNYRIPRGKDAAALTEADCREIIDNAPAPDASKTKKYKKRS